VLRLCCQQLATDLFPQACYRLTKPTDLSRLVDNLPQAGKINSLRQACEISGCVGFVMFTCAKILKCAMFAFSISHNVNNMKAFTVDAMEVLIKYCTNSFPQVDQFI
jgi:hypothetical protein